MRRKRSRLSAAPTLLSSICARPASRTKHGSVPAALHAPYGDLQNNLRAGGLLRELARVNDKRIVFYCAFGERSAMAVQAAQDTGLISTLHVEGGIDAWKKAGGALTR
jgi:sulfur dioxygenase